MTIDVATGISRILKEEGVGWVSTFPVCRVNNALGREGVPMLMMRDDRYAVAVADAFSRITAGSRIGVCTFQGGVNAAGMQYAYAGMAQAYEDGSPVLCITDGVPAGSSGNSQYDVASAMKTVSKWFGYLDKPERTPELMRRAFTMLRSGRPELFTYWLGVAAEHPRTFYGLLARHTLGVDTAFDFESNPFTESDAQHLLDAPAGRRALARAEYLHGLAELCHLLVGVRAGGALLTRDLEDPVEHRTV